MQLHNKNYINSQSQQVCFVLRKGRHLVTAKPDTNVVRRHLVTAKPDTNVAMVNQECHTKVNLQNDLKTSLKREILWLTMETAVSGFICRHV